MSKKTKILSTFILFYMTVVIVLITKYNAMQASSTTKQTDAGFLVFGAGLGLVAIIIIGLIPCLTGFYIVFKSIGSRSLHTSQDKLFAIPLILGGIFNLILPVFGWFAVPLLGIYGYLKGTKTILKQ